MNDSEFHQLADQLMLNIEETLDDFDGDVTSITKTNGGDDAELRKRHQNCHQPPEPLHRVWLATKAGGYHFNYRDGVWLCDRSGQPFYQLLSEAASAQAGEELHFPEAMQGSATSPAASMQLELLRLSGCAAPSATVTHRLDSTLLRIACVRPSSCTI